MRAFDIKALEQEPEKFNKNIKKIVKYKKK